MPNYVFSAQRSRSEEFVPLTICAKDECAQDHFRKVWHKMSQSITGHFASNDRSKECPGWANWKPHEWTKKTEDREEFIAWDVDSLAGLLNVRSPFLGSVYHDEIVYIEHVATSPGNHSTPIWNSRLRHVGLALIAYSIKISIDKGFQGAVGLHSTSEAESWYRGLNERREGKLFREPILGVQGYQKGAEEQLYFETVPEVARELLEDYRDV